MVMEYANYLRTHLYYFVGKIYTSNTNLAILEGIGITYPFLTVFFDRVWNGIVYYSVSDMRSRDLYNIFDDNNFDTPMDDRHLQKVSIDCRPSSLPSSIPTLSPTSVPTKNPTDPPTRKPSQRPTFHPTTKPSQNPSRKPSLEPSLSPSSNPTNHLSFLPSRIPSVKPTETPSKFPTTKPSKSPSSSPVVLVSEIPTIFKSKIPSSQPTIYYEYKPSSLPSITDFPSNLPSSPLSNAPSEIKVITTNGVSEEPTMSPTINPTILESFHPSRYVFDLITISTKLVTDLGILLIVPLQLMKIYNLLILQRVLIRGGLLVGSLAQSPEQLQLLGR